MRANIKKRIGAGAAALLMAVSPGMPWQTAAAGSLAMAAPAGSEITADQAGETEAAAADAASRTEQTIVIGSEEEFLEFAAECTLDAWSRDKYVILERDLDLTGYEFSGIPSFGGVFDGGGHRIGGYELEAAEPVCGLFRYVQTGAVVERLTVSGTVYGQEDIEILGGIAGENRGMIWNCTFSGVMTGERIVGGIAGINEAGGVIEGCQSDGQITADQYTGGISGQNQGIIRDCVNRSSVNITSQEAAGIGLTDISLKNISLDQISDPVAGHTDTGGIAGENQGVITDCSNYGTIGYPHMGYNVGGIAGRQSGKISGCGNYGQLYGRKDVGGIVGQMEPDMTVHYSKDLLQKVDDQMNVLSGMADSMMDHVDETDDAARASLDAISDYIQWIRDDAQDMADDVTDSLDDASHWGSRAARYLDDFMNDAERGTDRVRDTVAKIRDILNRSQGQEETDLEGAYDALDQLADACDQWDQSLAELNQARTELTEALSRGDLSGISAAMEKLREAVSGIKAAGSEIVRAASLLREELRGLDLGETSNLDAMLDDLDGFGNSVSRSIGSLSGLDGALSGNSNSIEYNMDLLSDEIDLLRNTVSGGTDQLGEDLRAINRQFRSVGDLISDTADEKREEDFSLTEDVSEQDAEGDVNGKVSDCVNEGEVSADINVGGIAGAMMFEVALDPEDDLTQEGNRSLNVKYETRVILMNCVSRGTVTARKSYAGGIVGRMGLGTVQGCQGYGTVLSEDGDYVGGVAGSSASVIRDSYGRVKLSGGRFLGGVAGEGTEIYNCFGYVMIGESKGSTGAVAGTVDQENGILQNNCFVDTGWAGVEGVSYAGQAEPVDYDALASREDIPDEFLELTVSFVADGKEILNVPVTFDGDLSELEIPEVPEKDGLYGTWSEIETEHIRFSQVAEAVYAERLSAVTSAEERETGGQSVPLALAMGSYSADVTLHVTETDGADAESLPDQADPDRTKVYHLSLNGIPEEQTETVIHLLKPEGKGRLRVWSQEENGAWRETEFEESGSYLILTMNGQETVLCAARSQVSPVVPAASGTALVLVLGIVALRRRRRVSEQKKESGRND